MPKEKHKEKINFVWLSCTSLKTDKSGPTPKPTDHVAKANTFVNRSKDPLQLYRIISSPAALGIHFIDNSIPSQWHCVCRALLLKMVTSSRVSRSSRYRSDDSAVDERCVGRRRNASAKLPLVVRSGPVALLGQSLALRSRLWRVEVARAQLVKHQSTPPTPCRRNRVMMFSTTQRDPPETRPRW